MTRGDAGIPRFGYIHVSPHPTNLSRIDLILISKTLLPRLIDAGFSPRSLSDHCPYWVKLSIHHNRPPFTWRLNPFWLTLFPAEDDLSSHWTQFFETNEGTASPQIVWEAFKKHARMTLTTHINKLKQSSGAAITAATKSLLSAEKAFTEDPTPEKANNLKLCSRATDQLLYEKSKRKLFFQKQRLFEQGERAGKLLAYLVHSEDRPPVVISLYSSDGTLTTEPAQVTTMFRDFFTTLYTSKAPTDNTLMEAFLNDITNPT